VAANCWGLSWKGTTGSWLTSWASATTPAPVVEQGLKPAGRSKRKHYFVDIDDQTFEVSSPAHAKALLERARDVAARHAQEIAAQAVQSTRKMGKKPIALPTPKITSPDPELREIVSAARRSINDLYRSAAIDVELAVLLARKLADEDEEDALLLLM
jgi:hypothetical protein